jgi:hypothetical protein
VSDPDIVQAYGLVAGPWPPFTEGWGSGIYAEILPAAPLRRPWKRHSGRLWRCWRQRWWFEIHSTRSPVDEHNPAGVGTHFIQHDGGGFTYRRAVAKAIDAIQAAIDEIDRELLDQRQPPSWLDGVDK